MDQHAIRYRRARSALLVLDPEGGWRTQYKILLATDIRGPFEDCENDEDDDEDDNARPTNRRKNRRKNNPKKGNPTLGQGHHSDSWIWTIRSSQCSSAQSGHESEAASQEMEPVPTLADDGELIIFVRYYPSYLAEEIVTVLWARGRARAERWIEEVALVLEEMRRTLAFCESKSIWWRERISIREGGSIELKDGIDSYACKQVNMWEALGTHFAQQWAPVIKIHNLPSDWPAKHCDAEQMESRPVDSAIGRNLMLRVSKALDFDLFHQPHSLDTCDNESSESSDSESDF